MKSFLILGAFVFAASAQAETKAHIELTTHIDLADHHMDLDEPKTFLIDEAFLADSGLTYRDLIADEVVSLCFVGDNQKAGKLISAIVDEPTGDSYVLESEIEVLQDEIIHRGTHTQGSGDYDFPLDFSVPRCAIP